MKPIYEPKGKAKEYGAFIVDDCGVGAGQIDIAVDSKETAQSLGVQWLDVYALGGE